MKNITFFLILLLASQVIFAQDNNVKKVMVLEDYGKIPLAFTENSGQFDSQVKFTTIGNGATMFFTEKGTTFLLSRETEESKRKRDIRELAKKYPRTLYKTGGEYEPEIEREYFSLKLHFVNANAVPEVTGEEPLPWKNNYFIGRDQNKWRTDVPNFSKIRLKNLYDGIDLVYYGNKNSIKYDFVVHPGADPEQILLVYDFGEEDKGELRINEKEELEVKTRFGDLIEREPYCYQIIDGEKIETEVHYKIIDANTYKYTFSVSSYNSDYPLIIDPELVYSTFIGGSDFDIGYAISVDGAGNAYITGFTYSTNFPTTPGAYEQTFNGGADAFVTKLNSTGSALVYSTFIGGSGNDFAYVIDIDNGGNAYITGNAYSTDFPTTEGAYNYGNEPESGDAFVTKLNSLGNDLVYSAFIGGSSDDYGTEISVDGAGNAYITGFTYSTDFPTTPGAYNETYNRGGGVIEKVNSSGSALVNGEMGDAFVTKLNSSGSALVYSTFIGGSSDDYGNAISVDGAGNAYITGATYSTDFPTTGGAYEQTYSGGGEHYGDAFVTKLNSLGSALVYSTYIGGSSDDCGWGIDIDVSGNACVAGATYSTNFPVTTGAYDETYNGGADVFVTKLNSLGSALVYSTFIGGSYDDFGESIVVDVSGNAYVIGETDSYYFPTTDDAYDKTYNGGADVFVTKVNSSGSNLDYSTYIGGEDLDLGMDIAFHSGGSSVYITGYTASSDFPITSGVYDEVLNRVNGRGEDAFVTKITFIEPLEITAIADAAIDEGKTFTVQVNATDSEGGTLTYSLTSYPSGMTINSGTGAINWTPDYTQSGSYTVTVKVVSSSNNQNTESFILTVNEINDHPVITAISDTTIDEGVLYIKQVEASDPEGGVLTYSLTSYPSGMTIDSRLGIINWTPNHYQSGSYTVTVKVVDVWGAEDTESFRLTVSNVNGPPIVSAMTNVTVSGGDSFTRQVEAIDPDEDNIIYSLTQNPDGMSINASTGLISWAPTNSDIGAHVVTIEASDGTLTGTKSFTITIIRSNFSPVFVSITDTNTNEIQLLIITLSATDGDNDSLTFGFSNFPTGSSLDGNIFTWTPTYEQAGDYSIIFTVSDGYGGSDSDTVTVVVNDVNRPPIFTPIPDTTIFINEWFVYNFNVTDPDGDEVYVTNRTIVANWLNDSEKFLLKPNILGNIEILLVVDDTRGGLDSASFVLTVIENDLPIIVYPEVGQEFTAEVGSEFSLTVEASDPNVVDILTWSAINLPTGAVFEPSINEFSWIPSSSDTGVFVITFSVDDGHGYVVSREVTITVVLLIGDIFPPVFVIIPYDLAVTQTTAVINWKTNELTRGTVHYGTTTAYTDSVQDTTFVLEHFVTLENLEPGTDYNYKVSIIDSAGNGPVYSKDMTLTTAVEVDTIAPIIVQGPLVEGITQTKAAVVWVTDEPATSELGYRLMGSIEPFEEIVLPDLKQKHVITLESLIPDTTYEYEVLSEDVFGNRSEPVPGSFRTKAVPDTLPPVIIKGPIATAITDQSAVIQWQTDELAISIVTFHPEEDTLARTIRSEDIVRYHQVTLTGLTPSTKYVYRVKSVDVSNNASIEIAGTFRTKAVPDTLPPRIVTRPNVVTRTHNTATIEWETDEIADSFVDYGLYSTDLDKTTGNVEKTTKHSILLTNLSSATKYYYKVRSSDVNGFTIESIVLSFITKIAPDIIPPVIIRGPIVENVTYNTATILWETDELSSSFVLFDSDSSRMEEEAGTADLVKQHRVSLTNLEPNTLYYTAVISKDISGNEVTTRKNLYAFYTKAAPDILPPDIIEGPVVIRTTENSATIKWKTNETSNSIIEYGTDKNYADGPVADAENVINHSVILTNLSSNTKYFAFVRSIDISGNVRETRDNPLEFRTKKEKDRKKPKVIKGPIVTNLSTSERTSGKIMSFATIEWTTDEPADGFVKFGLKKDELTSEEGAAKLTLVHFVTLTNLLPSTEYFYVVTSTDIDGNKIEKTRIVNRFRTPAVADTTKPVIVEGPIVFSTERSASFEWVTDEPSNSIIYYGIADSIESGARYEKFGTADLVTKHNVVITNLLLGEEYIFVITSADLSNNIVTFPTEYLGSLYKTLEAARIVQPPGGTGRFRTQRQIDIMLPVIISPPTVTDKTATTVTIDWSTDEQSNSIVEYDTTEGFALSKQSGSNVIDHSITLTNLKPATTYNYRIGSTDINGNGPSLSLDAAVTTEAETDIIPPQITAGPEVTSITDDQATIIWETDEPSDSYIEFTLDSTFGELDSVFGAPESRALAEDVTFHRITLTNLLSDTIYYFRVASVDLEDNGPTFSADASFRTAAEPDITPPQIVDTLRVVSFTDRTSTIEWGTDELSDSFVLFSKDTVFQKQNALRKSTNYYEYGWENNVGSARDVIAHKITLTNLEPGTYYRYTAGSIDKSDNTTYAPEIGLFKTSALPDTTAPEIPEDLIAVAGSKEVYLQWSEVPNAGRDLSGYNVYRKASQDYDYRAIATQIKNTFYYDTGLENDSTYVYRVTSVDNVYPPNESEFSVSKSVTTSADSVLTAPIILSPVNDALISDTPRPTLSIQNSVSTRQPMTYTFAVAYDSTFLNLALYKTDITEGQNTTSYALLTDLENYIQYYWRVRSNDGIFNSPWSQTTTFYIDVPVDIQLAVFTGKTIIGAVQLDWETVSENGNAGFNIYRSLSPDYGFEKINSKLIPISGDMKYTFEDRNIEPGKSYYYKLESISVFGISEQFEVLRVTALIPKEFTLYQNYPNPFNPTTTIRFDLPKSGNVVLKIYNILGQEINTLVNMEQMDAGFHQIVWDGTNVFGIKVASGVYIYQLRAGKFVKARKMSFVK